MVKILNKYKNRLLLNKNTNEVYNLLEINEDLGSVKLEIDGIIMDLKVLKDESSVRDALSTEFYFISY